MKEHDPATVAEQFVKKPALLTSVLAIEASSFADTLSHERTLNASLVKDHSKAFASSLTQRPQRLTDLFAAHPEFFRRVCQGMERVEKKTQ